MSDKKIGRPTENPKEIMIRVRVDSETLEKLDKCVEMFYPNRSEVMRQGINQIYNDLMNNELK